MQEFLHRLGLDDKLGAVGGPQYVHIAGTNGKGSVTAYLQHLFFEHGHKVGATFSPYVYDVRERVQTGLDLIPKDHFATYTARLLAVAETMEGSELGGPTEFEMKTALGFLYWADQDCDWVALEVGLGGRLDATNVVDPACSVIVSIGLDHTEHLGGTLRQIAIEKAGIIKPGRPVVVGDLPDEARNAVHEVAQERMSPVLQYGRDVFWSDGTIKTPRAHYTNIEPGIRGQAQGHNAALAIAALETCGIEATSDNVRRAIARTGLPGRFEKTLYKGRTFILDGAHNQQAAENLVATLKQSGPPGRYRLVTGRLEGHESESFFQALSCVVSKAYVAKIDFHRAVDPDVVIKECGGHLKDSEGFASSRDALDACIRESDEGETVLVTGSFYLVGEIGRLMRS